MANRTAAGLMALAVLLASCGPGAVRAAAPPSFTTASPQASPAPSPSPRPTERVLEIKIHYQEHNLTCEAAALKMALAYEGINVDEMTLIGYMTRDPSPARFDSSGHLANWGDPEQGFVGNPVSHIER